MFRYSLKCVSKLEAFKYEISIFIYVKNMSICVLFIIVPIYSFQDALSAGPKDSTVLEDAGIEPRALAASSTSHSHPC